VRHSKFRGRMSQMGQRPPCQSTPSPSVAHSIADEILHRGELPVSAKTGREQMQQTRCANAPLFDHFVGADEENRRDFETERSGRSQIEHEVELGRLHDR
jgi:hypothetical protein